MSIEENIERIAVALERIAAQADKFTGNVAAAAPVDPLAGAVEQKQEVLPATAEELRALAQKVAKNAGEKRMQAFLAFVKDKLCPKYKVDKLVSITAADVANAAKDLIGYAKDNQIDV